MLKTLPVVLTFIILALVVAAAGLAPARRRGCWGKPAGVSAVDGGQSGQVGVSWQGVEGATFYRIGWVAYDEITGAQNAGRPWLDAFGFKDVTSYGQTTHRLGGLLPGLRYAFAAGRVNSRFGTAAWSEWVYLTTAAGAAQCPAGGGETPMPQLGAAPAPDPNATPTPVPVVRPVPTPDPNANDEKTGMTVGGRDGDTGPG